MKKVTFLSRLFVTGITEPTNIISIGDPGEDIPIFGCEHKRMLRLEFDDIEEQISPEYRLFSHSDAGKVLRFIAECGDEDILVHCHAGISRSAAVAMFMNERLGYFLDLSAPCSGRLDMPNAEVTRLLKITYVNSLSSAGV